MVFATNRKSDKRILSVKNPNKEAILSFMRSFKPYAYAEGYIIDYKTGEPVFPIADDDYLYDDLFWSAGDVWNFEHNDLELNPVFCNRVLEVSARGEIA